MDTIDLETPNVDPHQILDAASRYSATNRPDSLHIALGLQAANIAETVNEKASTPEIAGRLPIVLRGHASAELSDIEPEGQWEKDRLDFSHPVGIVANTKAKMEGAAYTQQFGLAMSGNYPPLAQPPVLQRGISLS